MTKCDDDEVMAAVWQLKRLLLDMTDEDQIDTISGLSLNNRIHVELLALLINDPLISHRRDAAWARAFELNIETLSKRLERGKKRDESAPEVVEAEPSPWDI